MKFRKRPVEVEASNYPGIRFTTVNEMMAFEDWMQQASPATWKRCFYKGQTLHIPTLEGVMEASPGDWIIRGIKGELYPCKPDIFVATYEPVSDLGISAIEAERAMK